MRIATFLAALLFAGGALANAPAIDATKPDTSKPIPHSIFVLDENGDATHVQSGWQCPASFGDYVGDDIHIYDAYGLDVSCDYRLGVQDAIVTLYLTKRTGGDIKADFAGAQGALVNRLPGAALLPDAEQKTFASDRDWLHALYASQGGRSRDGVWYAWYGDWEYEIRVSWSPDLTDQVLAKLAEMTDAAKATGAHLARCAQSQIPARDGTPVTDGDKLGQLSLMSNISSAAAGLPDSKTGKAIPDLSIHPAEWCPEAGVQGIGDPVLLWHGLKADGSALPADRAMLMTYGDPPVLDIVADPLLGLMMAGDKADGSAPPIFVATMTQGDQTTIYGFFNGRPDAATLGRIMSDYKNGTARVFGGYNKKSNQIEITLPDKT